MVFSETLFSFFCGVQSLLLELFFYTYCGFLRLCTATEHFLLLSEEKIGFSPAKKIIDNVYYIELLIDTSGGTGEVIKFNTRVHVYVCTRRTRNLLRL